MHRRPFAIAVTVAMLMVPVALRSQAPATLTPQDYFEIENLIARYGHGFDSGAEQGYMWADVFTPDGVFMDGSGREYRSRDVIAQFGSGGPNSRKTPTNVGHYITNILIEPSAGGATARSYVMIGGGGGRGRGAGPAAGPPPAPSFGMGGTYFDDLVKTAGGWRIRERVLVRPGTTAAAVRAMTARTTPPAAAVPAHADASGMRPTSLRLTADDYAQLLHAQLGDESVVTNVLITPVSNGMVVKAYRMRADGGASPSIGPEGISFTFFAKRGNGWQALERYDMAAGSPLPDGAQQYAVIPETVTVAGGTPATVASASAGLSGEDYAAIRQLYARTAFDEDQAEPRHFVFNVRAERTSSGVTGRARVFLVTLGGQGRTTTVSEAGEYRDELVKGARGWEIRSRTFVPR